MASNLSIVTQQISGRVKTRVRAPGSQPSAAPRPPGVALGLPHIQSHGQHSNPPVFASPGAHELEQMQLILETIPVIREEDQDELLKVMPSFVNSTWEVKRPLRKLLPEVNSEGT